MGLSKMIRRNYFNVDNKYLAGGIHFITQQRYYKFTNNNKYSMLKKYAKALVDLKWLVNNNNGGK